MTTLTETSKLSVLDTNILVYAFDEKHFRYVEGIEVLTP